MRSFIEVCVSNAAQSTDCMEFLCEFSFLVVISDGNRRAMVHCCIWRSHCYVPRFGK
jgi:hypothetical protein